MVYQDRYERGASQGIDGVGMPTKNLEVMGQRQL